MTKGQYSVVGGCDYKSPPQPTNFDNSFYGCICMILIFAVTALLILCLPFLIKGVYYVSTSPQQTEQAFQRGDAIGLGSNEFDEKAEMKKTSESYSPPVTFTANPVTNRTTSLSTNSLTSTKVTSPVIPDVVYTTTESPTSTHTLNTKIDFPIPITTTSTEENETYPTSNAASTTQTLLKHTPLETTLFTDNSPLDKNQNKDTPKEMQFTTTEIYTTISDLENNTTTETIETTTDIPKISNAEWITTEPEKGSTTDKLPYKNVMTSSEASNYNETTTETIVYSTTEHLNESEIIILTTESTSMNNSLLQTLNNNLISTTTNYDEDLHDHNDDHDDHTDHETTTVRNNLITTTINPGPVLCTTDLCKTEASHILSYMNHSFDYCLDFYEYACGGMRHSNVLLEDNPDEYIYRKIKEEIIKINTTSSKPYINLKTYYESCLSYENIPFNDRKTKAMELFHSIGAMQAPDEEITNLTQTIAKLIQLGSFPIFEVGLGIHEYNYNKLQLQLKVPLDDNYFSIENEKSKECRKVLSKNEGIRKGQKIVLSDVYEAEYLTCMRNHSEYIDKTGEALAKLNVFHNNTQAPAQIQKVLMTVEEKLFQIYEKRPPRGKIYEIVSGKNYNIMTIEALQTNFRIVNWKLLFEILLNQPFDETTAVQVYFKEYFIKIFKFLNNIHDLWKVHNALLANFAYNIYKHFVLLDHKCEREDYCLKITSRLLPDVTSNLFLNSFNQTALKEKHNEVIKVYKLVRKTMLEEVNEAKWLDIDSAQAVKQKLNALKFTMPSVFESNVLEKYFDKYSVIPGDYLSNSMQLLKRRNDLLYSLLNKKSTTQYAIWMLFLTSFSSKSAYIYEINTLAVPEVILMGYNKDLPDALNMGRLGHVLAREIAHAFDRIGVYYNYVNDLESVISTTAFVMFQNMLTAADGTFSFSLSHIEDDVFYNFQLTSSLTLNERLSDISGTKLALETLRRRFRADGTQVLLWGEFTEEQLYFITLAQSFCKKTSIREQFPDLFESETLPPFLRIRNMLTNSEDFNVSFPCPLGSTMNAQLKVSAFPLLTDPYYY